jgi:hypothetical protein
MFASNGRSANSLMLMNGRCRAVRRRVDRLVEEREDIFQKDIRLGAPRALTCPGGRRTCGPPSPGLSPVLVKTVHAAASGAKRRRPVCPVLVDAFRVGSG